MLFQTSVQNIGYFPLSHIERKTHIQSHGSLMNMNGTHKFNIQIKSDARKSIESMTHVVVQNNSLYSRNPIRFSYFGFSCTET